MATKLNKTGLAYFYNRIKTIFALKTDLDTLSGRVDDIVAEGGEPNVIESVKVNGTALTPDSSKAVDVTVPTKVSDLTNDGDGTTGSAFATEDYVDQNSGKIDKIKVNGTEQTIDSTDKSVNITVPTAVSALTNDSGFQTATEVQNAIDTAIEGVTQFDFEVVTELPTTGEKGVIYLLSNSGSAPNIYDEYIWTGTSYEKIGSTDVDLTQYWAKSELVAITTAEIDEIIDGTSSGN